MAVRHGNRSHPPGKEVVHRMEPGSRVYLNSRYDTWIPNKVEPFHEQVCRVFFSREYATYRERERLRRAVIHLSSPPYWARAQRMGLREYLRSYYDGVIP
jgi:hypothetical protein